MEANVKVKTTTRSYDATRRRTAAEGTRRSIIEAATRTFLANGYAKTTMSGIANAAGVSLDTVYAAVGAKPVLFRLAIETAISGTDEAVPAEERDYVLAIRAEPDPRRKLKMYAGAIKRVLDRLAPLVRVVQEATPSHPEVGELWREIAERRARNMRLFVMDVAAANGLQEGVSLDEAADLVWSTNSPEFYLLLVEERGWTPEHFESWLGEMWIRLLLPAPWR